MTRSSSTRSRGRCRQRSSPSTRRRPPTERLQWVGAGSLALGRTWRKSSTATESRVRRWTATLRSNRWSRRFLSGVDDPHATSEQPPRSLRRWPIGPRRSV
jgi:hypothetical protein